MGAVREYQPGCQRYKRRCLLETGKHLRPCYGEYMISRTVLSLLVMSAFLAACSTTPSDRYPSLAIRDIERVYGSNWAVAPEPPPSVPAILSPELAERLAQFRAAAVKAHAEFLQAAPRVEVLVIAAENAELASERWVDAQVGIADLEASRSRAMIALADLDALQIAAELEGGPIEAIVATQQQINTLVAEEDQRLNAIYERLPG